MATYAGPDETHPRSRSAEFDALFGSSGTRPPAVRKTGGAR